VAICRRFPSRRSETSASAAVRPRREGARRNRAPSRTVGADPYGVGSGYVPPKMSELPKFAGQSCCGAGRATVPPEMSENR
jgi:hypothetical protein